MYILYFQVVSRVLEGILLPCYRIWNWKHIGNHRSPVDLASLVKYARNK